MVETLSQPVGGFLAIMIGNPLVQHATPNRTAELRHFVEHSRIGLTDPYKFSLEFIDAALQGLLARFSFTPEPGQPLQGFGPLTDRSRFRPVLQRRVKARLAGRERSDKNGADHEGQNACRHRILRPGLAGAPHPPGSSDEQRQHRQSQPQPQWQIGQNPHTSSPMGCFTPSMFCAICFVVFSIMPRLVKISANRGYLWK
ncbi:hypothetical protein [Ferrovibrio sp.]|uniref:hypothetical protein n=1 Tax=Ferrovibrio sp. TaxID=1917215 RepID=UPI0026183E1C|nr:hypothetical protein [Ferrovibrio sp.]